VQHHTASSPSRPGVSGGADKPVRADNDAGWHGDRSRPPVRSVPEAEPSAQPSEGLHGYDPVKTGPGTPYPRQWPRRSDDPTTTYSGPSRPGDDQPGAPSEAGPPPSPSPDVDPSPTPDKPPPSPDTSPSPEVPPKAADTPPKPDDQPAAGSGPTTDQPASPNAP
ncbi:MAG: hypothetical protein ACRDNL_13630, partial [Spirillospora sp.]